MTSPHELVNPPELGPAVGFSHAVVAAPGTLVELAGEIGSGPDGEVVGDGIAEQFDQALANVALALAAAGAEPAHLVSVVMYTTTMDEYRAERHAIGEAWRRHIGRHYPAMAMLGVTELFEPRAKIEILARAVIPG